MDALYAIGPKGGAQAAAKPAPPKPADRAAAGEPAVAQLVPYEVLAEAGRGRALHVRLYDDEGPLRARGAGRDASRSTG